MREETYDQKAKERMELSEKLGGMRGQMRELARCRQHLSQWKVESDQVVSPAGNRGNGPPT